MTRFVSSALASSVALALLALAPLPPASAQAVTVDGDFTEWGSRLAPTDDQGVILREADGGGQFAWKDAVGDARSDFFTPEQGADITEVRLTSTTTELCAAVGLVEDTPTGNGAPQIQIAVDTDRVTGSGEPSFTGFADTRTSADAEWERVIQTRFGSGTLPQVLDTTFTQVGTGTAAQSLDGVEICVPWSVLGPSSGPPSTPVRFTVAAFRSNTSDLTWSIGDASVSNALDVVTQYADPGSVHNTYAEVADTVVDHFFDVSFGVAETSAPLVVNRFVANAHPVGSTPIALEWIEIKNVTGAAVALQSHKLGDEESPALPGEGMMSFPAGTAIPAHGLYVVANVGADFQTYWGFAPDAELTPSSLAIPDMVAYGAWANGAVVLDDATDDILLLDGSNTVLDVASYGANTYAGGIPRPAPVTDDVLTRDDPGSDTDDNSADFSVQRVTVNVTNPHPLLGTVTSDVAGIACGADCIEDFRFSRDVVTLTATPEPGSTFLGWTGACTGTGTCQLVLDERDGVHTVTAEFSPSAVGDYSIPRLSITDVAKREGDKGTKRFVFSLTCVGDCAGVSVGYRTRNATAKAPADYRVTRGTSTFGTSPLRIVVKVKGDLVRERVERFMVVLLNPSGAVIADGTGVGKIRNDDS